MKLATFTAGGAPETGLVVPSLARRVAQELAAGGLHEVQALLAHEQVRAGARAHEGEHAWEVTLEERLQRAGIAARGLADELLLLHDRPVYPAFPGWPRTRATGRRPSDGPRDRLAR